MHWEQSTMYHNEVAQDLEAKILPTATHRPAFRVQRAAGENDRLRVEHRKPDGNEMAMGDSDDIDATSSPKQLSASTIQPGKPPGIGSLILTVCLIWRGSGDGVCFHAVPPVR
ncbi:MAG: hypothetical protein ACLVJ6_15015 [Merdibacter sp.]